MSLLDTASLIVTPNGYKEGKLYSVIPSDGSGDLSVTRATTATRVNSAGLVELVPYNLLEYSEDFTQWGLEQVSVTANTATAPNGTTTADTITDTSTFGYTYKTSTAVNASQIVTFSIYLKKTNNDWVNVATSRVPGTTYGEFGVWFNLSTGVIGSQFISGSATILDKQIESVGNGWYRCSITGYVTNALGYVPYVFNSNADNSYTSSVGKSHYQWGAQLVEGSTAKDYQKTETRLNIPRLDYSNGTCPSLLVEPQRTNLFTYSSSFDNAAWTKNSVTITANATTSPSGVQDADKMILGNGSQVEPVAFQLLDTTANTRTLTFFAKASEYNIAFARVGGSVTVPIVLFELSGNGSILHNQNALSYSIEPLENGWYRCSMTYAHGIAFAPNVGVCSPTYSVSATSVTSTGNGTSGIFIWGAQVEVGSYATSYIPTTSASVTRNVDLVAKTGISSLIGQTEGTCFIDFNYDNSTAQGNPLLFSFRNTAWTNEVYAQILASGGIQVQTYLGGVQQSYLYYGGATNGHHKIAYAYKQNDFILYVDGVQVATDTSGNVPTTDDFCLGYFNTSFTPTANYNAAALWQTRLTNTQLAQLTTI
jgi:hypothetical protein